MCSLRCHSIALEFEIVGMGPAPFGTLTMASGNWCGLGSTMTTKSSFFLLKLFMRDEVEVFAFKIHLIVILGRVSSKLSVPPSRL